MKDMFNQNIINKIENNQTGGVKCKKNLKAAAGLIFVIINNKSYLTLLKSRSSGKWMTPGGLVDVEDLNSDHPCFRTFKREFREEAGFKLPKLYNLTHYDYNGNTRIFIGDADPIEMNVNKFRPNNEATKMRLFDFDEIVRSNFTNPKMRNVVRESLKKIYKKGLLNKYISIPIGVQIIPTYTPSSTYTDTITLTPLSTSTFTDTITLTPQPQAGTDTITLTPLSTSTFTDTITLTPYDYTPGAEYGIYVAPDLDVTSPDIMRYGNLTWGGIHITLAGFSRNHPPIREMLYEISTTGAMTTNQRWKIYESGAYIDHNSVYLSSNTLNTIGDWLDIRGFHRIKGPKKTGMNWHMKFEPLIDYRIINYIANLTWSLVSIKKIGSEIIWMERFPLYRIYSKNY